jgi:hypothetical protein
VTKIINVSAFHKPLADAGLVPPNCRLLGISIGANDDAFIVRYEVMFTPEQTMALGLVLQQVAVKVVEDAIAEDPR